MRHLFVLVFTATILDATAALAQPGPGDVYREYRWFHEEGDAGQAIRVGGKAGEDHSDRGSKLDYINAPMTWPFSIDLGHATKAEVVFEKIMCHEETTGLAIQINGSDWFYVPEPAGIPAPQGRYQYHTYPVVRVPLSVFKEGAGNGFRLRVDPQHPWNWPQNLINGLHVRIYYDAAAKNHVNGEVTSISEGAVLGDSATLTTQLAAGADAARVDYVGLYEDVNYEGDGVYRQWHYLYFHGELRHHIGSAEEAPFQVDWDTSWLPDQQEPMQIAARITGNDGVTYQTPAITGLTLSPDRRSVELCKPYDIPAKWATRRSEGIERFQVRGPVEKAEAGQLVWSSWSPGYMRGIFINGVQVFDNEGPNYKTFYHRVPLADVSPINQGENILKTGMTPLIDGAMVHGMEVNWPGIMVLIRYKN